MRLTTALVLAAVIVTVVVGTASGYQVRPGHPRMLFRPEDVSELRSRCTGIYSSDYNAMKNWCDGGLGGSPSVNLQWHLPANAFVYLMSQDTRYLNRAKEIADYVVDNGNTRSVDWLVGGGLFYDWCYDALTPAERQKYGAGIGDGAEWTANEMGIGTHYWLTDNYHHKVGRIARLPFAGLSIYGDGVANSSATAAVDTFYSHQFGPSHMLCCLQEIAGDGGFYEGGYNITILCTGNRMGMDLWDSATNDDPFSLSTNYQNMSRYLVHEVGPSRGSSCVGSKQGDTGAHSTGSAEMRLALYDLANKYRDGTAQWMGDEIEEQAGGYINSFERWRKIIWRDPNLASVHPSAVYGEVSSALFDSVGMVYMRSGWDISTGSTDIYAVFRCEGMPAYHTHAHQNHFMIARGRDVLAIDSGDYDAYGSSHHRNYFTRTIAHNTITVYDPSEGTFGSFSNDGGQKTPINYGSPRYCGQASQPQYDRGEIVMPFKDTETFTYVKGDATKSYSSAKVSNFTREFVWLKPDFFVVLDRVTANSPNYKKRWLLHSIAEPSVSGDTAVITQGGSKLFVRTLLPEQIQTVKVGGPGHEFDVNGVNYAPSGSPASDAGAWRIEVSPATNANEHVFLTVLYACASSVTAMPEVTFIDTGDFIGANIAGQTVLFSKTGAPVGGDTCWVSGS